MQFPLNPSRSSGPRPALVHWLAVYRRVRSSAAEATRGYCLRLVQRALMIDPAAGDGLTVDVRFCDVR